MPKEIEVNKEEQTRLDCIAEAIAERIRSVLMVEVVIFQRDAPAKSSHEN